MSLDPCWGVGFSRPLCCFGTARVPCFAGPDHFTHDSCCSSPYDSCFLIFTHLAEELNKQTCAEYKESSRAWLSKNCLTWQIGDGEFERTVATDAMEAGLARCFHLFVQTTVGLLSVGVCTPLPCGEGDIMGDVPAFVDLQALLSTRELGVTWVSAIEVYPWLSLNGRADFVVAGFLNSGSSSLTHTLASHPEVELGVEELEMPQEVGAPSDAVDADWRGWLCSRLVPRRWVDQKLPLQASSASSATGAAAGGGEVASANGSSGARLRGFKNPLLLYGYQCAWGLARMMPKLLVAVRDPIEWLLSVFQHKDSKMGAALFPWKDVMVNGQRLSSWLGREDAFFGSILSSLLETWPANRLLVVELEHLRREPMASIALDRVCDFLGIARFSDLPGLGQKYNPGLKSSSKRWGRAELCSPGRAPELRQLSRDLSEEYSRLVRVLGKVGVAELGVSSLLAGGGTFERHCQGELGLPGAEAFSGDNFVAEAAQVEGRVRVRVNGEIGYEFELQTRVKVAYMGCGAGRGAPRRQTWVTLWDAVSRRPLLKVSVGPDARVANGFAYGSALEPPRELGTGRYALTVQVSEDLGLSPTKFRAKFSLEMGRFNAGVFSRRPWTYPEEVDEHAWEEAYVGLATIDVLS